MKISFKSSLFGILICLLLAPVLLAQTVSTMGKKKPGQFFWVDYAVFKADDTSGQVRLEAYFQIYNAALNFARTSDSNFEADYELAIKVFGKNRQLIDSYKQSQAVRVIDESRIMSKIDYRTNQASFRLDPGKYELEFSLSDPKSQEIQTRVIKAELEKFENKHPRLSDIELVQMVSAAQETESAFDKGKLALVPSVTHRFGNDDHLTLYFYIEAYNGREPLEKVRIETMLRHMTKGMLYRDSLSSNFEQPSIKQFREIAMEDFHPGQYELIVTLKGPRNKELDVKYKDFELIWTEKSLLKHDFKTVIKQLEMIGQKDQINELKKYEGYEDRLRAFNDFWRAHDPTPGTAPNETKQEFYRRVNVANQSFTHFNTPGWRTDRGRVYILYGEPDQIDDYPLVPNSRPYQEWHYYRDSRYRKFVFVDDNEDGDYRLVYPYDGLYQRPDF